MSDPVVEVTRVSKTYFRESTPVPVLEDINLRVEQAESVALMGTATLLAGLMGVAGGLFPAFRASRMTIAKALRGL